MEESREIIKESTKKPARRKYIITIVCFVLLVIGTFAAAIIRWEQKSDQESEKIIRQIVAEQLNKDSNELTEKDFAKITFLTLREQELSDIKVLKKFTNLKQLYLLNIKYPANNIPKWMSYLGKIGIINLSKRFSINLGPLKKLTNLQTLWITDSQVSNFKSLKGLTKLQDLSLYGTDISDCEPIKRLTKLRELCLEWTQVSDLKPLKELTKLQILKLRYTLVSDLEPLKELKSLNSLYISDYSDIRKFPPNLINSLNNSLIKTNPTKFRNINKFQNININDEQIEELKKALPGVDIIRESPFTLMGSYI